MAICEHCHREMTDGTGCTGMTFKIDGEPLQPVPHDGKFGDGGPCRDCGAPVGGFHHPGCHNEDCPSCGWQAISCGCADEEDEDA